MTTYQKVLRPEKPSKVILRAKLENQLCAYVSKCVCVNFEKAFVELQPVVTNFDSLQRRLFKSAYL